MTDNNNNEKIILSTIYAGIVGIVGIYCFRPKVWGSYSIYRSDGLFKIVFKWNTAYCIDLHNNRVIWDEPIIARKRGVILTLNHEYKCYGRLWKEYGRSHLNDEEFVGIFYGDY